MKSYRGFNIVEKTGKAPVYPMVIGGQKTHGSAKEFMEVKSPVTGEVLGYPPMGTREDAAKAVETAHAARRLLADLGVWERAELCYKMSEAIKRHAEPIAKMLTLEQGKPVAQAQAELVGASNAFRDAAEQIKWMATDYFPLADKRKRAYSYLKPKGVVAAITPWNFPVALPCLYYFGCGLAVGNTFVWNSASTTSIVACMMMDCFKEVLPDGIINLVTGAGSVIGDEIVTHPLVNAVAFTGSSAIGEHIAKRAAGKTLMIEMGGNGPTIVFDDVDIAKTAARVAAGSYSNSGQICTATERVLVDARVKDEFVEQLVLETAKYKLGDPFDPTVNMGPLNNDSNASKTDEHIADAVARGAKVLCGGKRAKGFPTNLYYEPTVIDNVHPDSIINIDETFGPVAPVLSFSSEQELYEIVEKSRFGLNAAVFTNNLKRAMHHAEKLNVGIVNINEMSCYWESHIPAGGGAGTISGLSRTGGRHTIFDMGDLHTITIDVDF